MDNYSSDVRALHQAEVVAGRRPKHETGLVPKRDGRDEIAQALGTKAPAPKMRSSGHGQNV
jgi:hypothetical protein